MAFINRISDINNKLDINIENQNISNNKLTNIDDNIETIRTTDASSNTYLSQMVSSLNNLSVNIKDSYGNLLSSTGGALNTNVSGTILTSINNNIINSNTKLDTLHTDLDGLTFDGSNNLYVNVNNSPSVGLLTSANTIKIDTSNNRVKLTDANDDAFTSTQPTGTTTTHALETYSYTVGLNNLSGLNLPITSSTATAETGATVQALDIYIHNSQTTLNNTLFGGSSYKNGLNVYQIMPKVKQLVMSGISNVSDGILAGISGQTIDATINFGIQNPKFWFVNMDAASTAKTIYYDYVNANGEECSASVLAPVGITWTQLPLQSGTTAEIVSINNYRLSGSLTTNDILYVCHAANLASANITTTMYYANYYNNYTSLITCPNNCIMYITNIHGYSGGINNFQVIKYDSITGARKQIFYQGIGGSGQFNISAGNDGCIGGYITGGESIHMGISSAQSTYAFANVIIKYLS